MVSKKTLKLNANFWILISNIKSYVELNLFVYEAGYIEQKEKQIKHDFKRKLCRQI